MILNTSDKTLALASPKITVFQPSYLEKNAHNYEISSDLLDIKEIRNVQSLN